MPQKNKYLLHLVYIVMFCSYFQVLGVEQVEDEIQIMTKHEFEQFEKKLLAEKEKE